MESGTVLQLHRFPVKSLRGEQCESLEVNLRGVENDRLYAINDADGKFGSHKTTRRFRKMSGLFDLIAEVRVGHTWLLFPDGSELIWDDPAVSSRLSDLVGQPVTLKPEASVSHFDDGSIHIVTQASLSWLKNLLADSLIDPRRFRSNIVVGCTGCEQLENDWVGRRLNIGTCEFEVVSTTERCLMTTLAQDELPDDPAILTAIGRNAELQFGVYAKVLCAGIMSTGDSVKFSN